MNITPTTDYLALSTFFRSCGLETHITDEIPAGSLGLWRVDDAAGLRGALALEMRDGAFVLAALAVREDARGSRLGEQLLAFAEERAAGKGAETLWLVGKVPAFYVKYGWEAVPREAAPDISHCFTCPQFNESCFPAVMRKRVG